MTKLILDKKDKDWLIALFESIDEDKDGMIDVTDIGNAYSTKYGIQISEQELQRIGKQINVSKEGGITVTEFILGACNKSYLINEPNLRQVFHFIDASGGGFVSRKELMGFLGVADETFIGIVMEEADDDCDGGMNMKEFINLMMRVNRLGA
jgi:Ca2+-binding EF-hand superfamily protein